MTILETIVTSVATFLTGGLATILIPRLTMTKNEQYQALIMLIEQLQKNVNENNDEIIVLKRDVREWRDKYYKELDEKNKLSLEVNKLRLELQKFNIQHNK
jgi:hypothetical protein